MDWYAYYFDLYSQNQSILLASLVILYDSGQSIGFAQIDIVATNILAVDHAPDRIIEVRSDF